MATMKDVSVLYPVTITPMVKDGIHMKPCRDLQTIELSQSDSQNLIYQILSSQHATEYFNTTLQGLVEKHGVPLLSAFGSPKDMSEALGPFKTTMANLAGLKAIFEAWSELRDVEVMIDFGDARGNIHTAI